MRNTARDSNFKSTRAARALFLLPRGYRRAQLRGDEHGDCLFH
jgi:hypothetical protein